MDQTIRDAKKLHFTDIRCPNCGAPAEFDIIKQSYLCGNCGSQVQIGEAIRQKEGFRKIRMGQLQNDVKNFNLSKGSCSGCGAVIIFGENEAVSNCAFCGRSLVRSDYLDTKGLPESIIPFAITEAEAKESLRAWCRDNKGKAEARHLKPLIDELRGYYLPYELVRGPVHMSVSRMDGGSSYSCEGFIDDEYINRSKQLDNLLLDGMEPFDQSSLREFDFGYVAGQSVKISDIGDDALESRTRQETAASYTPAVQKTLETKAVDVYADVSGAIRLPVLLPVYYISKGPLMAAVNGQTGKVSVRAEKESHYYFLPWWFKAILATAIVCLALFGAMRLFGMDGGSSLYITGLFGLVFIIIMFCLYSDTTRNKFSVEAGRKIFTSGGRSFQRVNGVLVQDQKILEKKTVKPVFFQEIDGKETPVEIKFTTPGRVLKTVLRCLVALFLPVIIALLLNGFDFQRLELGGSAVWFCIAVPIVPVYLIKFGIVELYEKPLIYILKENGRKKRYRKKSSFKIDWDIVKMVLRACFVPPASLAVWFGIICFCTICYLTAFGFD